MSASSGRVGAPGAAGAAGVVWHPLLPAGQKRRHYEDGCPARRHVKLASRRPTNARYTMLERTLGYQRSSGESSHRIVSSRCAPVEIRQKGTPISSSNRSR